jgi:hypothetical protein
MGSFTVVIVLVSVLVPIVLVVGIMRALMKSQQVTDELLRSGAPAHGRILQLGTTGGSVAVMGHRHLKLILTVEVYPPGGSPYHATFEQLVSELQLPSVQPGASIELRIDPRNPARMAMASVGVGQPMQHAPGGFRQPPGPMGGPIPVAVMTPQYKSAFPMMAIILFITTVPTAAILLYVFVDFSTLWGGSSSSSRAVESDEAASEDEEEKPAKKGVCARAALCCKVVSGETAAQACGNFEKGMPVEGCRQALASYEQAAKQLKKTCE